MIFINNHKSLIGIIATIVVLFASCTNKEEVKSMAFFDSKGVHIGDSIYWGKYLHKIVFKDTSLIIDSIVFTRYNNPERTIKFKNTYLKGKPVFENIDYYENGTVKRYMFIDEDKPAYYYYRSYTPSGELLVQRGEVFFQGYLTEINPETLEIKKGTTMRISVFHPNPPDCKASVFVKLDGGKRADVFYNSDYISFLKSVAVDNNKHEKLWTKIDLWLELVCGHDTLRYNKPVLYKVVK